jgi:hypothetical protein
MKAQKTELTVYLDACYGRLAKNRASCVSESERTNKTAHTNALRLTDGLLVNNLSWKAVF